MQKANQEQINLQPNSRLRKYSKKQHVMTDMARKNKITASRYVLQKRHTFYYMFRNVVFLTQSPPGTHSIPAGSG